VCVAGETSTGSQIGKQEYDVRQQHGQLCSKDSVAEAMIPLLVAVTVECVQQRLTPKLLLSLMLKS